MAITEPLTAVSREDFRLAVRRNIRALLGMCNVEQKDLAPAIHLSESQLSDRLTSSAAWRDEELLNVARAFTVTHDVVTALTPDDFHRALAALPASPVFHGPSSSVQLDLFRLAA